MARLPEPVYLPMPDGYAARVAQLEAEGYDTARAHWMAACEASGAVARREYHHRHLFWFGDAPESTRALWDEIADHEGARHEFHQAKDTLVGYLAYRRQTARASRDTLLAQRRKAREFIKANGLWEAWVQENRKGLDGTER
jgi:hypothetical protein